MKSINKQSVLSRTGLAVAGLAIVTTLSGCNNAQEGFLSGASLGALAGMGLGSLSGDMGKGAAAGAIIGGLGGAIMGDQNARSGRSNYGVWSDSGSSYYNDSSYGGGSYYYSESYRSNCGTGGHRRSRSYWHSGGGCGGY
ncbi:MAG: glycine zipper domain-containing protein [Phycisphaerales bacterium]